MGMRPINISKNFAKWNLSVGQLYINYYKRKREAKLHIFLKQANVRSLPILADIDK